jgi:phosphate transport system substrate-binding protein
MQKRLVRKCAQQVCGSVLAVVILATASCNNSTGTGVGTTSHRGAVQLEGAGSTLVLIMMQKWKNVYDQEHGVEVNYQDIGSGGGVRKLVEKTVDFGCSDAPLNEQQEKQTMEAGGEVVHVPLVMGGVVPCYNLPSVTTPLKFSGEVLARIFLGEIKKWNDPAIAGLNQDVALPDLGIAVVHRSEGSGTTFVWTDFLSKVSPLWQEKVGAATSVNWPCGIGLPANAGVAGQVKRTEGAIGYVELIYALKNDIKFGSVRNAAGHDVTASLKTITAAAEGMLQNIPADLKYSLTNAAGDDSYPIACTVWAITYVNQPKDKRQPLVDFLHWITHDGQKYAEELQYAPLPPKLIERVDGKLALIHDAP